MIAVDTNLLVYAHRSDAPAHASAQAALSRLARDPGGWAIHDARIAAICIEHAVEEFWTADRDFSRYPDLRTRNPLIPTLHEPAPARR